MAARYLYFFLLGVLLGVCFPRCNGNRQPSAPTAVHHRKYEAPPTVVPFAVDSLVNDRLKKTFKSRASRSISSGEITTIVTAPCIPDTIQIGYNFTTTDTIKIVPAGTKKGIHLNAGLLAGPGLAAPGLLVVFPSNVAAGYYYDIGARRSYFSLNIPLLVNKRKGRP